jgi:predicted  nucleic acid-binding Zn-ribbon protein
MTVATPPARASEAPAPRRFAPAGALFARLKRFWAGDIDLGRVGMAVTLPVLAWVFYTTSSGMIDIMQKEQGDLVGIAGTLVATTAVLVMLASTSWSLGADLAALIARRRMARERMVMKTLVTAAVFLFVFSISAFFSFTYYYNNIFKLSSRRIVAELQPMELAADVVLPATKQINAAYEAASARIAANPAFKAYLDSLDGLIDTARTAGPALREAIRKSQEAQQAVLARAAQQAAAELESARAAGRQYDEAQAEIAALERNVADFDAVIKAKQDEIAALAATARQEEQLAVDAEHGLDNKGAVCGPNCRGHRAKAEEASRRAAMIRQTLAGPTSDRAGALRKREALSAQAIALKQRAELAATAAKKPIPKAEAALDLDAALRDLVALRDQLRVEPTWTKVREAKPLCEPILTAARQSDALPASVARDFACEPQGEARDLLSARDEVIAARAAFDRKCGLETGLRDELNAVVVRIRNAPASDKSAAANGFNEAKGLVDACVVAGKAVGLSEDDVRELLKKSDAYLRAHSTERNKFELAREAFWSFTPDSTMAICVAMAQDAFLFIMKFLSEIFKRGLEARERRQFMTPMDLTDDEEEPVEIRAMKAMLRVAKPVHGDMSEIDPQDPALLPLAQNVRDNLVAILNRLVRDEIAHVERKGAYVVDNVTISQVESRLFAAVKPRALRAARYALEGSAAGGGPRAYYGDMTLANARRRRPTALERYLAPEPATTEQGAGQAG